MKKKWNNAICSNMDEPRYCHTEWSKSDKDKYHMILPIYEILKKKMVSSAFLRLLIFLPVILILVSSLAFHIIFSAYKLNIKWLA